MQIRPIGHSEMYRLIWRGQMDGDDWDMRTNSRKANCKVCGHKIPKGAGAYWRRYGPNNTIAFTRNYLCADCQAAWGNLSYRTVKAKGSPPAKRLLPSNWSAQTIKEILGLELI